MCPSRVQFGAPIFHHTYCQCRVEDFISRVRPMTMEITEATLILNGKNNTFQQKRIQEQGEKPTLKDESLVSIHKSAIQRILQSRTLHMPNNAGDPEILLLEQKYFRIRQQRMQLWSDLEQARHYSEQPTVLDELSHVRRQQESNRVDNHRRKRQVDPIVSNKIQENLADRMYLLRKRRRIVGSHRIAGISILPCPDKNILGIRLDICVHGEYVARHHLFFDLVTHASMNQMITFEKDALHKQPFIRLAKHTVPSGIPLTLIVDQTLGSTPLIPNDPIEPAIGRLEECIGQVYDACYIYAIRKQIGTFLRDNTRDDFVTSTFAIQQLICGDTYESFQFVLQWQSTERWNGTDHSCHMSLSFDDPMSALPTTVTVRTLMNDKGDEMVVSHDYRSRDDCPIVADDDSDAEGTLDLNTVQKLFRTLQVENAIREVVLL